MEAVLTQFRANHAHITEVKVVSDGAGCYQGNHLFAYLPFMVKLTGVRVTDHYISVEGQGKTYLDGHFSEQGKYVQDSVRMADGRCDITNAASLVVAANRRGGRA
eukprot:gene36370-biopygen30926